jgi:hypothetical protein
LLDQIWEYPIGGRKIRNLILNVRGRTNVRPTLDSRCRARPEKLTRGDYARLAYASAPGDLHALPFSTEYLGRFEENHCYDRY